MSLVGGDEERFGLKGSGYSWKVRELGREGVVVGWFAGRGGCLESSKTLGIKCDSSASVLR